MSPRAQPRTGFGKDSVEIESYVRGLARRRPDVVVTTLRLANLMGAGVDSHVTRYLSLQVVPRVMGFDARLQFLHPSDAVDALLLVTRRDVAGTFNVAAPDIVTLPQALRKMGRPTVGVPRATAPLVATLVRQARLVDFSADQIDALTYGRAMDTSRFTSQTGFVPKFTSLAALEEFVGVSKVGLLSPERVDSALEAVRRVLGNCGGARWLRRRSSRSAAAARGGVLAVPDLRRHPKRRQLPGDPGFESEEVPPTPTLGALLGDLVRLASRSLGSLKSVPITQLGSVAADPQRALASLAETLGVDWDESLEEMVAFHAPATSWRLCSR